MREIRQQTEINHTLDSEYRVGETNIIHTKELIAGALGTCESTERSIANEEAAVKAGYEKISTFEAALLEKDAERAARKAAEPGMNAEQILNGAFRYL